MITIQDAKRWIAKNRDACMDSYKKAEKNIPSFLKSPKLEEVWCFGCLLRQKLCDMGAKPEDVSDISFSYGQRCLFQDPLETAVAYLNEYELTMTVKDKPGAKLAAQLTDEYMPTNKKK